jgi:hypothetical protein
VHRQMHTMAWPPTWRRIRQRRSLAGDTTHIAAQPGQCDDQVDATARRARLRWSPTRRPRAAPARRTRCHLPPRAHRDDDAAMPPNGEAAPAAVTGFALTGSTGTTSARDDTVHLPAEPAPRIWPSRSASSSFPDSPIAPKTTRIVRKRAWPSPRPPFRTCCPCRSYPRWARRSRRPSP